MMVLSLLYFSLHRVLSFLRPLCVATGIRRYSPAMAAKKIPGLLQDSSPLQVGNQAGV